MKWNLTSKRFLLVAVMTALYGALLFIKPEIGTSMTPFAYSLAGGYILGESWKPTNGGS